MGINLGKSAVSSMNFIAKYVTNPVVNNLNQPVKGVTHYLPKDIITKAASASTQKEVIEFVNAIKTPMKSENLVSTLATLQGIWMAGFYILNTNTNNKIPADRKKTLNLNTVITTALALGLGIVLNPSKKQFITTLSDKIKGSELMNSLSDKVKKDVVKFIATDKDTLGTAKKVLTEAGKDIKTMTSEAIAKGYLPEFLEKKTQLGLKQIVDLVFVTAAFRFFSPVIATPLAEVANKFLVKHKFMEAPKDKKEATQKTNIPVATPVEKTQTKSVVKFA